MPFGQYKGMPLGEIQKINPSYLAWLELSSMTSKSIRRRIAMLRDQ
jgi:uncharacterized protein (DUF3820 family)